VRQGLVGTRKSCLPSAWHGIGLRTDCIMRSFTVPIYADREIWCETKTTHYAVGSCRYRLCTAPSRSPICLLPELRSSFFWLNFPPNPPVPTTGYRDWSVLCRSAESIRYSPSPVKPRQLAETRPRLVLRLRRRLHGPSYRQTHHRQRREYATTPKLRLIALEPTGKLLWSFHRSENQNRSARRATARSLSGRAVGITHPAHGSHYLMASTRAPGNWWTRSRSRPRRPA